jgi:hypothetical protein
MTCFGWRPQLTADPVRKERRMRSINATKLDRYYPALFGLNKLQKTLDDRKASRYFFGKPTTLPYDEKPSQGASGRG